MQKRPENIKDHNSLTKSLVRIKSSFLTFFPSSVMNQPWCGLYFWPLWLDLIMPLSHWPSHHFYYNFLHWLSLLVTVNGFLQCIKVQALDLQVEVTYPVCNKIPGCNGGWITPYLHDLLSTIKPIYSSYIGSPYSSLMRAKSGLVSHIHRIWLWEISDWAREEDSFT